MMYYNEYQGYGLRRKNRLNQFHHTVPTMLTLGDCSSMLLASLPEPTFTKRQFDDLRKSLIDDTHRPMSLTTFQKYGLIKLVGKEPYKFKCKAMVWTNPKTGEEYLIQQLAEKWSDICEDFDCVRFCCDPYSLPYEEKEVEMNGGRNLYAVDMKIANGFF